MPRKIQHVLSLGAGVQSSTLALMLDRRELPGYPRPNYAVFADTQAEPADVYKWLAWLKTKVSYPILTVTAGNLEKDSLRIKRSKRSGLFYLRTYIPFFTRPRQDGESEDVDKGEKIKNGILFRKCTAEYKVRLILRTIRNESKIPRGCKDIMVHSYMGISVDEAHRMKANAEPWAKSVYPLVDANISRQDCIDWMQKHYGVRPPRSACVFCPYHSDAEWVRLRDTDPSGFKRAVEFERRVQGAAAKTPESIRSDLFLHSSRIPLDKVTFKAENPKDHWGNECEGMCGV